MNKERLEKLAAHIEALPPDQFDMTEWFGTPCCIGGHTDKLFDLDGRKPASVTAGHLELQFSQWDRLFFPEHYETAYSATPQQAAAVVRHLAETGEVAWERFVS